MELKIETTRLELPLELVFEILDYVDDKDLVHLLTICKACHRVLKERLYYTMPPLYQRKRKSYDLYTVLKKIS